MCGTDRKLACGVIFLVLLSLLTGQSISAEEAKIVFGVG